MSSTPRALALVLCLATTACGRGRPADPDVANRYPAALYIVGNGTCGPEAPSYERAACAAQRAREEVVLAVRARITALTESRCQAHWTRVSGTGEPTTQTTTGCDTLLASRAESSLELTNTAPQEQWCEADRCFARLAVNRGELQARLRRQMDPDQAKFESLVQQGQQQGTVSAFSALAQAEPIAVKLDEDAVLLAAVQGEPLSTYSFVRAVIEAKAALLAGFKVCFESPDLGDTLYAPAAEHLARAGVAHVSAGPPCDGSDVRILLNRFAVVSTRPSTDLAGKWVSDLRITLEIRDPSGTALASSEILGRGIDRDAQAAESRARANLGEAVATATLRSVLGAAP